MTTNPHAAIAPLPPAHHGRRRRLTAVLVIAGAAFVGMHTITSTGHAAPGPRVVTQAAVSGPQSTTDWLGGANR